VIRTYMCRSKVASSIEDSCRVSASVQGQEQLSHIDAMHSQFTLLLRLHGYINFSYLYTWSCLFG